MIIFAEIFRQLVVFLYFCLIVIIAWYIPGNLILRDKFKHLFSEIIVSSVFGFVLWCWQGVLFGYLQIRWASYMYILLMVIFWIRSHAHRLNIMHRVLPHKLLLSIVLIGVILQLTVTWPNGMLTQKGMMFCCGDNSDNIYFAAVTNEVVKKFPPEEPGLPGVTIQNYHYWSNIAVGELVRVFYIPLFDAQFRYVPLFVSLFSGALLITFGLELGLPTLVTSCIAFFFYLGGDAIQHLTTVLGKGPLTNMSSLEDGIRFLGNPPRAYSICVYFLSLILFDLWTKRFSAKTSIVLALTVSSLVGFKVYTGIAAIVGIVMGVFVLFLKQKKIIVLLPLVLTGILAYIVYFPVNSGAGGLFFTGNWRAQNFIEQPALGLQRLEMARAIYASHNNIIGIIRYEMLFFAVYMCAIFGTKLIALFQSKKSLSLIPISIHIYILTGLGVSVVLGLFFQQSTGGANTFNFVANAFIILSLYAGLGLYNIYINKRKITLVVMCIIMLFTLPRAITEYSGIIQKIGKLDTLIVSNEELTAWRNLGHIAGNNSYVLVRRQSFDNDWYTPYIPLLSKTKPYISGAGILNSHNIPYKKRELVSSVIFTSSDVASVSALLTQENIKYLVMKPMDTFVGTASSCISNVVFTNTAASIYRIHDVDRKCEKI